MADESNEPAAPDRATADPDSGSRRKSEPFQIPREWVGFGVVLAGVIVVGIVLGRVTAPDADPAATADQAIDGTGVTLDTPTETTTAGLPFPTGDVDRADYWAYGNLTPVVTDTFDRDDGSSLGTTDTGQTWRVERGSWAVRDRAAAAGPASSGGPGLAVVDAEVTAGLVEVTLMTVTPGSGLVFRYQDAQNHWSMTADPESEAWTITRVVGGEAVVVGSVPGQVTDGTTISVNSSSDLLRFLIEGVEHLRMTDGALIDASGAGLIGPTTEADNARSDRFFVAESDASG